MSEQERSTAPSGDDDRAAEEVLSDEERARRRERASEDLRLLTRYAVVISAGGLLLSFGAVLLGWPGAETFTRGLLVGCLVSVLNLRVLARAAWALMADRDLVRALLGFGASFTLLVGTAALLAVKHPELVLGFGIGLSLPAPAGVWFGLRLRDDGEGSSERA